MLSLSLTTSMPSDVVWRKPALLGRGVPTKRPTLKQCLARNVPPAVVLRRSPSLFLNSKHRPTYQPQLYLKFVGLGTATLQQSVLLFFFSYKPFRGNSGTVKSNCRWASHQSSPALLTKRTLCRSRQWCKLHLFINIALNEPKLYDV